ncbi:uncharacterized protein LOC133830659, partial [Humulus lupulus]|uniref:uncharacterized protein LOC133830659 n=1 Tax=Humulus lupulus TaxID=3486 RepID=UPI002B412CED
LKIASIVFLSHSPAHPLDLFSLTLSPLDLFSHSASARTQLSSLSITLSCSLSHSASARTRRSRRRKNQATPPSTQEPGHPPADARTRPPWGKLGKPPIVYELWRTVLLTPFKLITVFLHEASHAIACKLTCGHVEGIQVHANEGGVTQTRGGVYWLILPAGLDTPWTLYRIHHFPCFNLGSARNDNSLYSPSRYSLYRCDEQLVFSIWYVPPLIFSK